MAEGVVQLPLDGPGKKLRTQEVVVSGQTVEQEVVTLAKADGTLYSPDDGTAKAKIWDDQSNRKARVTLLEELAVASRQIRNSDSFANGIDPGEWTTVATGTGAVSYTAGVARFSTGTTANSTVQITTVMQQRFFPGTVSLYQSGVTVGDTGLANNIRRWGLYDDNNGYFFELNGTTFRVVNRSNVTGSVVDTPAAITGFTLDTSNHTYEIEFQGNACLFLIDRTVVASLSGQTAVARTGTLDLPGRYENLNSGGLATDVRLDVRGYTFASKGHQDLETGKWGYNAGVAGTLVLTGNKRIIQITAIALEAAGSMTINGGDTIVIPYGSTDKVSSEVTLTPKGSLTDPTIVFTNTDSYFVEWVS